MKIGKAELANKDADAKLSFGGNQAAAIATYGGRKALFC